MVRSLALSPDGATLVVGGVQRSLFVAHLGQAEAAAGGGGATAELRGQHCAPVAAAAFSSDGRLLVTAGGRTLMVWDGAEQARQVQPPPRPLASLLA